MRLIYGIFVLLVCAYPAAAQSNFYQGKTVTVVAGANAGSTYDLYVRLDHPEYRQTYSWQSQLHRAEYGRRGFGRWRQLCLQRQQA